MERQGYEVQVATDGEQALAAVASFRPDLVMLDVMVPLLSGYEVCQRLRARPEHRDLRIVMVTAKGRHVEAAKGMEVGADAYVTKPFATRELVELVERTLEGDGAGQG